MIKRHLCILFSGLLLSACNGSSGENEDRDPDADPAAFALSVQVLDENCQPLTTPSQANNTPFCVQASLSQGDTLVANRAISFTTNLGVFTPTSALSNSDGISQVMLTSDGNVGAGSITATFDDITAQADFEFTQSPDDPSQMRELSTQTSQAGNQTNQFNQGQDLNVTVTVRDGAGTAISGAQVNFATSLVSLSAPSALTNQNGEASVTLSAADDNTLGVGTLVISLQEANQTTASTSIAYEVKAQGQSVSVIRAGHFNQNGDFVEGTLGNSLGATPGTPINLAAGGTLGLSMALVDENDNRISTPVTVAFSSDCAADSRANIDAQATTINGVASTTYQDISCAGSSGNLDLITASVTASGATITLNQEVALAGEELGFIRFDSAEPNNIVLKGTGGVNKKEISTVTFTLESSIGNPMVQQDVSFSLDNTTGGVSLASNQGTTNSQGQVSTQVIAGTVPTTVRVLAQSTLNGQSVQSQSDLLSINTGMPDQNSISIAASTLAVEGNTINGTTSTLSVWLSDSFNNPVPDGTSVNFIAEGGQIEATCQSQNGRCDVTWQSTEPRADNHRITILATATGHESFIDANGNNVFDSNDGSANASNLVSSGYGQAQYQSGFGDLSDAWLDQNENRQYDTGEPFIDSANDGVFSAANGAFDGPQCQGNCGASNQLVRKALTLIVSSSYALYSLYENNASTVISSNYGPETISAASSIARGETRVYVLRVSDTALQTLATGSTMAVSVSDGEVNGVINASVGNIIGTSNAIDAADVGVITMADANSQGVFGGQDLVFTITNDLATGDDATTSIIEWTITSPSGAITSGLATVRLD